MKKVKLFGVLLLSLIFGVVGVKADETLQSKIDSADGTVKLDKDYQEDIVIGAKKNVTLDLNGHTLTGYVEVRGGEFTIDDTAGGGKIESTGNIPVSNGKLTLKNGEIESKTNYGIYGKDNSVVTIDGGKITAKSACLGNNNTTGTATFVINGGTLTSNYQTVYLANPVGLTINGGTLNGGLAIRMGKVTINGGTINATTGKEFDLMKDYYSLGDGYAWTSDAIHVMANTYTTNASEGNALDLKILGGNIKVANGQGSAVAIYDIGYVEQDVNVTISNEAILETNATDRGAYDVLSLEDIGVENPKAGYGKYSGKVHTTITGGIFTSLPDEIPEGYKAYEILNSDEEAYIVLSDDEEVYYDVDGEIVKKEDLDKEELKKIEEAAGKYTIGAYYNIVAGIIAKDQYLIDLPEETPEELEIKLDLPRDLPAVKEGFTRKYVVIRVHNGEATVIKDVKDNGDGTVTFKSDKFSTYALAYVDEENKKEETKEEVSPKTFDAGTMSYIMLSLVSIVLGAYAAFKLKKRLN